MPNRSSASSRSAAHLGGQPVRARRRTHRASSDRQARRQHPQRRHHRRRRVPRWPATRPSAPSAAPVSARGTRPAGARCATGPPPAAPARSALLSTISTGHARRSRRASRVLGFEHLRDHQHRDVAARPSTTIHRAVAQRVGDRGDDPPRGDRCTATVNGPIARAMIGANRGVTGPRRRRRSSSSAKMARSLPFGRLGTRRRSWQLRAHGDTLRHPVNGVSPLPAEGNCWVSICTTMRVHRDVISDHGRMQARRSDVAGTPAPQGADGRPGRPPYPRVTSFRSRRSALSGGQQADLGPALARTGRPGPRRRRPPGHR